MATLVSVKTTDGKEVVINLDQVIRIEPDGVGSFIHFVDQLTMNAAFAPKALTG